MVKRLTAVGALLAIFLSLSLTISISKSNTWDESAHFLAGYAYLEEGMDFLSPLNHPVLGRAVTAVIPYILLDLDFNRSVKPEGAPGSDFFGYSLKFLFENRVEGRKLLFLSRLGNIVLGLVLGVYAYIWSRELWGPRGGVFSLLFYSLSPDILAHSSISTTDIPVTAFFFIASFYFYWIAARGISFPRVFLSAIFTALAMTSKHTAFLLAPVAIASFVIAMRRERPVKVISAFIVATGTVYLAIWAIYGFRFHSDSPYYAMPDWAVFGNSPYAPFLETLRSIKFLPESYLYSIAGVLMGAGSGKAAFLMGEYSTEGWWYYFPLAFLIKTPIPMIFFLIATVVYIFFRHKGERGKAVFLLLPVLLIFTVMGIQKVNIGLRHVLPAYPFIFTLIGFVPNIRTASMVLAKWAFIIGTAWYVWSAASIHPHQLAYFNEFIGGPGNGYRYLVDSNLDWGQDLTGLKDFMERNGVKRIKLAYFGMSDPRYYGIDYEYLPSYYIPGQTNAPVTVELKGWFAVSATMLQGVYLRDRDLYKVFRDLEPVEKVGYSIFVYKL